MKFLKADITYGIAIIKSSNTNIEIDAFRNLLLIVCDFIRQPIIKKNNDNISTKANIDITAINI